MAVRKFLDNDGAAQLNTLLINKFATKRDISDGDIIKEIKANNVRIWELDDGVYKLPVGCIIYYYGATNTSSKVTLSSGGILFITHYSTTYKSWFLFCGSNGTTRYLYSGYSTATTGGQKAYNLGAAYLTSISSYVKDNLDYATAGTTYALSAYQGHLLGQNKADKTELPTKISDLTNDSNFVEDSSYVHTDNNFTSTEKTKLSGIESGAQENNIDSITVNGTAQLPDANKNVNLNVPQITYGTTDLTPGTSELPTGSYYFVYE